MPEPFRVAFLMDQVAGHITNYRNLQRAAEHEPALDASWWEIRSYRPDGRLEQFQQRFPSVVPSYLTGNARAVMEIRGALRGGGCDAIFTNARAAVLLSRRFAHVPTMVDFDVTPLQLDELDGYESHPDPQPMAWLKRRLATDFYRSASLLQAWSTWAARSAVRDYGVPEDKVVVNPPGVDLEFWRHRGERSATADRPRVLFVGGDFRRKGGDLLLELHAERGDFDLHIVTREPVAATPGVTVYDDLEPNTDRLRALYHRADAFVLPSRGECFGLATVEAMAAGLPVITSDVGGAADIVEDGRNGYLTAAGDRAQLGTALDALLADAARRRVMGAHSRQLAEERFDLCRNAARTFSHLKRLARQGTAATPASKAS